jgi:curved DNA-binding protein CbpA
MGSAFVNADTIPIAENNQALAKVLLDYHATPGRYALNVGQPILAFQHLGTVIAWAQGKISAEQASQSDDLQKVAIFFVQRACLRQEGTHYDVMGLGREFTLDALRLRYRALISLTHPDKNISGFPANAAVRINKAYDTLRDVDERAHYDATLSVEPSAVARPAEAHSSSYHLEKLTLGSRLQAYMPNFKSVVFVAIPILAVLLVVAMVATSQNPTDLQLVEKSSGSSSKPSSSSSSSHANASDTAKSEPPQAAASLYAELNESARKGLSNNNMMEPWASKDAAANVNGATNGTANAHINRTFVDNAQRHQFRGRAKEERQPLSAVGAGDFGSDTGSANVLGAPVFSKLPEIETARATPAVVEPMSQLSLKVSSGIPVISESRRLYSQLNEARFLVTQLISALERPKDAEFMQNKMARQGVSGNLFGLALPHLRQSAAIRIDQLVLKEKLDNNHLVLNGSVALWLGATANQLMPYKYAVNVEFKDVESGPVMSSFDLKEAR